MRTRLGRRGIAAAEFALVLPAVMLLLFGVYDVANLAQASIRLERAVNAGARHAAADATDPTAIRNRVIAAWPDLTTADVPLPVIVCECGGGAVSCAQSCPGGMVQTVTVTAQRSLSPILLQGLPPARGSAVVRLR